MKNIVNGQTFRLARKTAQVLMRRACPRVKAQKSEKLLPGVDIYIGQTGPQGLILISENDWKDGCGRIKLTIKDGTGSGTIIQYFWPDTLTRDFNLEANRLGKEA